MTLVLISGPHHGDHFRWDNPEAPHRLEVQTKQPGPARTGRRSVGVAIYQQASPRDRDLPEAHIPYKYVRFRARDRPALFRAVEADSKEI